MRAGELHIAGLNLKMDAESNNDNSSLVSQCELLWHVGGVGGVDRGIGLPAKKVLGWNPRC